MKGKEDKLFIEALIGFHFPNRKNDFEIIPTGGWTKLLSPKGFNPQIKDFNDQGFKVLVIFDADTAPGGGFGKRLGDILEKKKEHSLEFEVFLFPDNQSDGDLESLLEQIVNDEHRAILDCFKNYEECLTGLQHYQLPIRKSKIYAYIDAFPKSREEKEKFKKGNFLFSNESMWNLNSTKLKPLVEFISNNHEN